MATSLYSIILVALGGCLAAGFFAGSETGLVSLDRLRVRGGDRRGFNRGSLLARLMEKQEGLLATTLVGTNIAMIGTSVVVTTMAASLWSDAGTAPVTIVLTLLFFVLGELLPKAWFRRFAHEAMAMSAIPLLVTYYLFRPVTLVTGLMVAVVFRALGRPRRSPYDISREELESILSTPESRRSRAGERQMLERALLLQSTTCREVMIPLADVKCVPEQISTEEILEDVREGGPTRLPVFRDRVDQIVGLINVFDILYDDRPHAQARLYMRPVEIVPDSQRIDTLLVTLRRKRSGMGAVVNEFGSCVGIVTVEDLVEEIVGELADEHEAMAPRVIRTGSETYLVDGRADLDDLERELGAELGGAGVATIGGLVLSRLERVPSAGETVRIPGWSLEVVSADRYGVRRVRMRRQRSNEEMSGDKA